MRNGIRCQRNLLTNPGPTPIIPKYFNGEMVGEMEAETGRCCGEATTLLQLRNTFWAPFKAANRIQFGPFSKGFWGFSAQVGKVCRVVQKLPIRVQVPYILLAAVEF